MPPSEFGQPAYDWLSRGLIEGIVQFIQRAKGSKFGVKGAFYEFQWPTVLDELSAAKKRGVDIDIVFDDIDNATGPHKKNEKAIATAKLKGVTKPRTNGTLMHNKFLVLTENGKPKAVLFGSTNLTENGIFGHANCTHVVENEDIAAKYLTFHAKLATDPETSRGSDYKAWNVEQTPAPATDFVDGMAPVFSPRSDVEALDWYGELAASANDALFMTFAFGMHETFRAVYGKNDKILRFGLMEKEWNGRNKEAQIAAIRKLQARPNVVIAIGNRIAINNFDQWLIELDKINPGVHVQWVHLKFMLVDPLSDAPIVVTRVGEFPARLALGTMTRTCLSSRTICVWPTSILGNICASNSHYAFREAVQIFLKKHPGAKPEDMRQGFLIEDEDWTKSYFDPADRSARMARRLYFAG